MLFNSRQRRTFIIWLLLITAVSLIWLGFGGEIFTKTQVLVEKKDDLFGTSYKEWKDQFVLGLDYTLVFIGLVTVVSSYIVWKQKQKAG